MELKLSDAGIQVNDYCVFTFGWKIERSLIWIPETFRNCADIAITSNTGGIPPLFVGKKNPFLLYYRDYRAPEDENVFALIVR